MSTSRPSHGGGAPFGIDLEAGVARITIPRSAPAARPGDEAEQPEEDVDETPEVGERPESS